MKKTLFVAACAVALVFGMTASAFAISPAYSIWSSAGVNAGSLPTPHSDYQLTTEKCSVCHSVHAAAWSSQVGTDGALAVGDWAGTLGKVGPAGSQNTPGSEQSQLLLRGSVANACSYCHIQTAIGVKQPYGAGVAAVTNYLNAAGTISGYGHGSHAACSGCHSVHGASTIAGAVATKILKNEAASGNRPYQAEIVAAVDYGNGLAATIDSSVDRNVQVTSFCTKCHGLYAASSSTTLTSSGYFNAAGEVDANGIAVTGSMSKAPIDYHTHPLKSVATSFTAPGASSFAAIGKAAFLGSNYCRSCHSAGTDGSTVQVGDLTAVGTGTGQGSFPHFTPNDGSFLTAATDSAASASVVGSDAVGSDGVCLRCHRDGAGSGVGLKF